MLKLNYYSHIIQFILGREKWISLVGSKYTTGHFSINDSYTTVQFIPDDPDSFTYETTFESVLSPYTLKLVCALANDADDPDKVFTDLDYDLLEDINYNSEFDCTSDENFLNVLYDFSRVADGSHLIYTHDIVEFVLKHSGSYADIIDTLGILPESIPTEKLFNNGLYSAAEYLYFNVTPAIIYRYIDTYKEVYNID